MSILEHAKKAPSVLEHAKKAQTALRGLERRAKASIAKQHLTWEIKRVELIQSYPQQVRDALVLAGAITSQDADTSVVYEDDGTPCALTFDGEVAPVTASGSLLADKVPEHG